MTELVDFDGDSSPVASRPPPPVPHEPEKACITTFTTASTAGSAGATFFSGRTVSDGGVSNLELGEELARRLEKMDGKLDWLVSRFEATNTTSTLYSSKRGPPSVDSSSETDAVLIQHGRAGPTQSTTLRSMISVKPPPMVVNAPAPSGPGPGPLVLNAPALRQSGPAVDPDQSQQLGAIRVNSRPRLSSQTGLDRGSFIPNLSAARHASGGSAAALFVRSVNHPSVRSVQSHHSQSVDSGVESHQLSKGSRGSLLARKMFGKSASQDVEVLNKRIQALPKVFRKSRNKTVDYVWTVLDDPSSGNAAWWIGKFLEALVLLSVLVTFMQTVEKPHLHGWSAAVVETVIDVVFLTELCIRFCCSPSKISFLFISHTWIDIAAASAIALRAAVGFVLPESQDDAISIVLLGLVPIIRLLKILRHFETFNVLIQAVYITMEALPMLLYAIALITMTFALLIYCVEPELFESPFRAHWFCLVTVTTVGYGDYTPETTVGIAIVMILIVLGVGLMAVPIGIIGNTFNQVWNARDYSLLLAKTRMKLRKWGYTAHDIPTLFELWDFNGNGVLEPDEFCELVNEMKIGLPEDRIRALFEHMDKDGSGGLDAAEFAMEVFPDTFLQAFVGHVTDIGQDMSPTSARASRRVTTISNKDPPPMRPTNMSTMDT
jgi:voltage-gated potassium channel